MRGSIQRFQGLGMWTSLETLPTILPQSTFFKMTLSQSFLYSNNMLSWLSLHYDENMFDEAIRQKDHEAHRDSRQRISLLCASFPTKPEYRLTTQGYICARSTLHNSRGCPKVAQCTKLTSIQSSPEFVYTSSYLS